MDARAALPVTNLFRFYAPEVAKVPADASSPLHIRTAAEVERERRQQKIRKR